MENKDQTPVEDVQTNPQGTEQTETTVKPTEEIATPEVDYKTKFSESTREAQRLLEELKAKEAEIDAIRARESERGTSYGNNSGELYPGFEELGKEEQERLLSYTNSIKNKVKEDVYNDPAIAFSRQLYNEKRWNEAFDQAATKFPELREAKDDFKKRFYNQNNVPDNINNIVDDLSKIYLFEKAKDIGAKEATEQNNRIEIERSKGGTKSPVASRSLEDWHKLMETNPAEFAKRSKEYNSDLESGKLK